MSLILGIDPGSRATGYAFLQGVGQHASVIASGTIRLDERAPLSERLGSLRRQLDELLDQYQPYTIALEDLFVAKNMRSALLLGHARGVILAAAGLRSISVVEYAPASVKQAIASHGRAEKSQIQRMVQVLLNLDALPQTDEADALAIALCHSMKSRAPSMNIVLATKPKRKPKRAFS